MLEPPTTKPPEQPVAAVIFLTRAAVQLPFADASIENPMPLFLPKPESPQENHKLISL